MLVEQKALRGIDMFMGEEMQKKAWSNQEVNPVLDVTKFSCFSLLHAFAKLRGKRHGSLPAALQSPIAASISSECDRVGPLINFEIAHESMWERLLGLPNDLVKL